MRVSSENLQQQSQEDVELTGRANPKAVQLLYIRLETGISLQG
jgi:hypothetical protein